MRESNRYEIATPSLLLDIDALKSNITTMMDALKDTGRSLRPHAKSHKCSRIARLQIAAGAVGVCCATIDEAECMHAGGIPGLLITSPLTTGNKLARLADLVRASADVSVVADHPDNVRALAQIAAGTGQPLSVLVDIDLGFGRTGVLDAAAAVTLAGLVAASPGLRFTGIQAYGGHLQHIPGPDERLVRNRQTHAFVDDICRQLTIHGMPPAIVSGGGTGTHMIDSREGPFTEIQAGSYIFMDAEYQDVVYEQGRAWPFANALLVQSAVTSGNVPNCVTVDAGTKAFALNGPRPRIAHPAIPGATYEFAGDEHGRLRLAGDAGMLQLGERIEFVIPHCDPTVALYDFFLCVQGDRVVDLWPIDARRRTPPAGL